VSAASAGGTVAVVPRWEWRAFGERLGAADSRFDALAPEAVRESDEVYLLSGLSDASVKLRDGLLDVKVLREVSADGLERWEPVLKAPAALSPDALRALAGGLGVETLAVRVHKRRAHYLLDGCMAERSEIRTEHGAARTIGIESEDPELVRKVVAELGFDTRSNGNLPHELKRLAGFGERRPA
jgi:exopolyphosphatase/guanosine-5'-triphosphate,3'-diphosphate pyrophosphatase